MGFRKAQEGAAGGFEIPKVAANRGITEGDSSQALSFNPDTAYVDHRAAAHSTKTKIAEAEAELGFNDAPPAPEAKQEQGIPVWDTVIHGLKDIPLQIPAGSLNAFNEMGNGLLDVAKWAEDKIGLTHVVPDERAHGFGNMVFGEPETLAGRMANGVSQFITGFLPASRVMKGMSVFQTAKGGLTVLGQLGAGGISDFVGMDPHAPRLANLIQDHPSLANPVTAFLAADPKDSEATARFKSAVEGMGLGVLTEGLIGALKFMRGSKRLAAGAEAGGEGGGPKGGAGGGGGAGDAPAPPAAGAGGGAAAADTAAAPAAPAVPKAGEAAQGSNAAAEQSATVTRTAQEEARIAAQAELDAIQGMTPEARDAYFKQFKNPAEARAKYDEQIAAQAAPQAAEPAAQAAAIDPPRAYDYGQQKWVEGEAAVPLLEQQMKDQRSMLSDLTPEARRASAEAGALKFARRQGITDQAEIDKLVQESISSMEAEMNGSAWEQRKQQIDAWRKQQSGQAEVPRGTPAAPDMSTEAARLMAAQAEATRPAGEKIAPSIIEKFEGPGDLVGTKPPLSAAQQAEAAAPVLENAGGLPSESKAVNINLNKIDGSTDLKQMLISVAKAFGRDIESARRGVVTDAMVARLAADLNMTAGDLAKRLRGQALNAEEITAARVLLNASAEDLVGKARAAMAPGAGDVEKAAFLNALEAHKAIQLQVSGATAEAGRALRALRQVVGVPGEAERARMLKQMVSLFEAGPDGQNVQKIAESISSMGNVADIAKFTQKSLTRRLFDAALEVRYGNLLSGAKTFTTNLISNSFQIFGKVGESYLAEGLGKLRKGAEMNADRVVEGEARAMLASIIDGGVWDGLRLVRQSIQDRTPIDGLTQVPVSRVPALSAQNFNLTGWFGQALDYLGVMTRLPGHGLNMTDGFFKVVNYRMEVARQATREAGYRGLEGEEREAFIKAFMKDPPDEIKIIAQEEARVQTFTNLRPDTGLLSEQTIRAIQGTAAGRIALPFLRTNFNMIDYVMQRNPVTALISPRFAEDMAAGGARRDLALAKVGFGSTLMLAASSLAAGGIVTGGGPQNPDAKKALESTGWRPYSLKIGNKYYSYNRVEPIGTLLSMAADWAEIAGHVKLDSTDVSDMAFAMAVVAGHIGPAENLVESMVDLGELFNKPEETARKWLSTNVASSAIPNLIRQFSREGGDPKLDTSAREYKFTKGAPRYVADDSIPQEILNKLKASIPGYSSSLPAQHNLFGEVVTYDPGLGPDVASPIYVSEMKDSPIRKEIARLTLQGFKFDMPGAFITTDMGAVPLNAAQHQKYIELSAGVGLKVPGIRKLEDELNYQLEHNFPRYQVSPNYKKLDAQKYAFIMDTIDSYRKLALKQLSSGMDPVGEDLVKKYTDLGKVKYEGLTGRPAPVTIKSPSGRNVK